MVCVVTVEKFELLFASGLSAYIDGYYREAVASLAAALERYYEFSVWFELLHHGLTAEQIRPLWKPVSGSSERQLGMFIGLRGLHPDLTEALLPQADVEFRNAVIHRGSFPDEKRTRAFAERVYAIIYAEVRRLQSISLDLISAVEGVFADALMKEVQGEATTIVNLLTPLSLRATSDREVPFDEALAIEYRRRAATQPQPSPVA